MEAQIFPLTPNILMKRSLTSQSHPEYFNEDVSVVVLPAPSDCLYFFMTEEHVGLSFNQVLLFNLKAIVREL